MKAVNENPFLQTPLSINLTKITYFLNCTIFFVKQLLQMNGLFPLQNLDINKTTQFSFLNQ
jgi:hypothetical protein